MTEKKNYLQNIFNLLRADFPLETPQARRKLRDIAQVKRDINFQFRKLCPAQRLLMHEVK